ncbi:hypothetical protein FOL47_009644 [Perkinsus chesapeaki]|uniref:Reactive oxygen species modulator 1 n=1 Tax=Perkinsus chesapeaki TaxID=330153 RepID=A0A7J6L703_PERCH|nr:hypothetical protein FOL47_009644 [Perkinsus chesapeaki]
MVWPFSSGSSSSDSAKDQDINRPSETHIAPPSGGTVPLPEPPKGYKSVAPPSQQQKAEEFKGFTPPPPKEVESSSYKPINLDYKPMHGDDKDDPYASEDFSKFASSVPAEEPGFKDDYWMKISSGRWISNPRARACYQSILMGGKMGGAVGGIFGVLAGGYSMVAYRNFWYLPMSIIGGAASFGFFLGCGMIIRCEEFPGARSELPAASADYRGPQHLMFYPIDGRYLSLKDE